MTNHPTLTDYFVCCNLDRNPANVEKWKALVAAWRKKYRKLTVHWKGNFELTQLLSTPKWRYLETYYFDAPDFSLETVNRRTEAAIKQLHRRFTPRLHNKTNSELNLAKLLALPSAVDDHYERCYELTDKTVDLIQALRGASWRRWTSELEKSSTAAVAACQAIVDTVAEGNFLRQGDPFIAALDSAALVLLEFAQIAGDEARERRNEGGSDTDVSAASTAVSSTVELIGSLRHPKRTLELFRSGQSSPCWLVTGEGGMGKSHLLATIARELIAQGGAALMFLGEQFQANSSAHSQICEQFGWHKPFDDLLACLQANAQESGRTSLLIVDAVNETPSRGIWKTQLLSLQAEVARFSHVHLLVSCREDWLVECIPEPLLAEAPKVHHEGYDLDFAEAVAAYFEGYDVGTDGHPPMLAEFHNPLFLKTVCETYQGRRLPDHPLSFLEVLDAWDARIGEQIQQSVGCPRLSTKTAISKIVLAMADRGSAFLDEGTVRTICQAEFPVHQEQASLYRQLQTQGFMEEVRQGSTTQVRLQYERFYDIRVAQAELESSKDATAWTAHWEVTYLPRIHAERGELLSHPKLFAFSLLLPERFGIELPDMPLPSVPAREWNPGVYGVWNAWIEGLEWRQFSAASVPDVRRLFSRWSAAEDCDSLIHAELFRFSYIEGHPLNADYVHELLSSQVLAERELNWTIPQEGAPTDASYGLVDWCDDAGSHCSAEQARLAATLLIWLTSTTNWSRRDRVTRAAIRLLAGRGAVVQGLFTRFWPVDDPYVQERLLAIVAGVLPTLSVDELTSLASVVCSEFFGGESVPLNMMQRKYARFIAEYAHQRSAIADELWAASLPPYRSTPIDIWTEAQVAPFENDPRYRAIKNSIAPEEMGAARYGDFGRYVMGGRVNQFVDPTQSLIERGGLGSQHPREDGRPARRYVWRRIHEMGWTPERFETFESSLRSNGRQRPPTERISKKFQWIGYYEYIGYLMDHKLYHAYLDEEGMPDVRASTLLMRDFDPSSATFEHQRPDADEDEAVAGPAIENTNSVPAMSSFAGRVKWVASDFESFLPHLHCRIDGAPRLTLSAHISYHGEPPFGRTRASSEKTSQWVDVRSFIVPLNRVDVLAKSLTNQDFWGRGVDLPRAFDLWLSEFPWHPTLGAVDAQCARGGTWFSSRRPVSMLGTACAAESDARRFVLPSPTVLRELAQSSIGPLSAPTYAEKPGYRMDDSDGEAVIWGTATNRETLLAVDFTKLMTWLEESKQALLWCCLAEKRITHDVDSLNKDSSQSSVVVLKPNSEPIEMLCRRRDWPERGSGVEPQ